MPSPADELRQILRGLDPAFRQADLVLLIRAQGVAAIAAADRIGVLEGHRRQLEESIAEQEGKLAARAEADEQGRVARLDKIAAEIKKAEDGATEIKARVGREAQDFIAQTEKQRQQVANALAQTQRDLKSLRAVNQQAAEDRRKATETFDRELAERKAKAEAEIADLTGKVAALRKEYREITDRLSALTAASR